MNKIIIDVFGCDNTPSEIITGALLALHENSDFSIILAGNEAIINQELELQQYDKRRVEVLDAKEVIDNNDIPTTAIRTKKESSLVKAMFKLKDDSEVVGLISAGSTGAVLCSATLQLGRLEGISRPALATFLPTENNDYVCLLDCGANVDVKPDVLEQFAQMGKICMQTMYGIKSPKVALVSVGTEDKKGNEFSKAAFLKLKESNLNFVGNMEARDALTGKYDVLVADGFTGNVLLKSIEGTAKLVMKKFITKLYSDKKEITPFIKSAVAEAMAEMDFNSRGGAVFLGVNKIIVKAHGAANQSTIKNCILQVQLLSRGNLIENIKSNI